MPGQENFLWFIADKDKILDGEDVSVAMPSVFDGKMRQAVFAKQKFTDEFEPVGGLFYGQCAEYCGNSHAHMSFRALAQTDEDFPLGFKNFKITKIPICNQVRTTLSRNTKKVRSLHSLTTSWGRMQSASFVLPKLYKKDRLPTYPKMHGNSLILMIMRLGNNSFPPFNAYSAMR